MNKFKNIILFLLAIVLVINVYGQNECINQLSKKEKKQGCVLLFDGKTSNGWTKSYGQAFPEKGWEIRDGILMLAENAKAGDIVTVEGIPILIFRLIFECHQPVTAGSNTSITITQKVEVWDEISFRNI